MGCLVFPDHYIPLKLLFYEAYLSREDALRREKYFKTTDGKRAIKLMIRETLKIL
jgi:putative endonuclease